MSYDDVLYTHQGFARRHESLLWVGVLTGSTQYHRTPTPRCRSIRLLTYDMP